MAMENWAEDGNAKCNKVQLDWIQMKVIFFGKNSRQRYTVDSRKASENIRDCAAFPFIVSQSLQYDFENKILNLTLAFNSLSQKPPMNVSNYSDSKEKTLAMDTLLNISKLLWPSKAPLRSSNDGRNRHFRWACWGSKSFNLQTIPHPAISPHPCRENFQRRYPQKKTSTCFIV